MIGPGERVLCAAEEIEEGAARGFPALPGRFTGLFAVRKGGEVRVYVNSCPHIGLPLEPLPNRFLDTRKAHIVCAVHGARFRIEDGVCISGPCIGQELEMVPCRVEEGMLVVPADAGE
ncbi:Rieske 2Fe-2S domain-containing protein [Belnapia sp. F-4-1]|uniref:Rieske (2Fe-2S) protein n=1 Tax=Belnapia sp. F-4-1 TaxID=1545443 RepID=UPI001F1D6932|nr:Rieske 2Fe-2S domain-containing protein [Belnapia sp. F-4-1]